MLFKVPEVVAAWNILKKKLKREKEPLSCNKVWD
jgi:hypothetical protein